MTKFVIRSMSTTDYRAADRFGPEQKPVPYHIYLKAIRGSAWWTTSVIDMQYFETEAEAIDLRDSLFANEKYSTPPQVVPVDAKAHGIPDFWEKVA